MLVILSKDEDIFQAHEDEHFKSKSSRVVCGNFKKYFIPFTNMKKLNPQKLNLKLSKYKYLMLKFQKTFDAVQIQFLGDVSYLLFLIHHRTLLWLLFSKIARSMHSILSYTLMQQASSLYIWRNTCFSSALPTEMVSNVPRYTVSCARIYKSMQTSFIYWMRKLSFLFGSLDFRRYISLKDVYLCRLWKQQWTWSERIKEDTKNTT